MSTTNSSISVQISLLAKIDALLKNCATHLTAALSVVVGVTGTMMFFHIFKGKVQGLHEWLGLAFLLAAVLHALRHRYAIANLLCHSRMKILLALTALISTVFLALTPAEKINPGKGATQALVHAPIRSLAPVLGLSPEEALSRLGAVAGSAASDEQSIDAIARLSHTDPIKLLMAVMVEDKK